MFCNQCGTPMPDEAKFCTNCGAAMTVVPVSAALEATPEAPTTPSPAQAAMSASPPEAQIAPAPVPAQAQAQDMSFPSLLNLRCPQCNSLELEVKGVEGGLAKSIGVFAAFGAVGNLVMSANAGKNLETTPIKYKCVHCGNQFTSMPLEATADEYLSAPCAINFERVSNFVGMAVVQIVYLNGIKIGPVKNGKTVSFATVVKYNTLYVTDQGGVAFKGVYRFEAQPGGTVNVRFNRKFL